MHRKKFISAFSMALTSWSVFGDTTKLINSGTINSSTKIPPYLKKGSCIGITSAAGFINEVDCKDAVEMMQSWGFRVKMGNTIGKKYFTFGGTDVERLADLQSMLNDDSIDAIMIARGGYGLIRIVDQINFSKFKQHPKWIIGFSDVTVLHSHIQRQLGIATIHAKMCNSFVNPSIAEPVQLATLQSIEQCLKGNAMQYEAIPQSQNKTGIVTAALVGGNLKTIETLAGSVSDINTANKILVVEDTGEYLYSIDRMFYNLKRSGKLRQLAGLIIGGFKIKKDDEGEDFGKTIEEIVLEKVNEYNYPVCFNFPVGHQKNNYALKLGALHELNVSSNFVQLKSLQ
ncbi:LD-carboxypeptidase [Ferruginibacter yonginensis]|uniref:LD-carboxypeptidase n=1 Tax=Ferruginibacter yonginensis TaxID=1310416 RepID=A0ABV8QTB7_9BACT